jgi:hypothetical protein
VASHLTANDNALLQTACAKILEYGETVGVSAADMLPLLQRRARVRELSAGVHLIETECFLASGFATTS